MTTTTTAATFDPFEDAEIENYKIIIKNSIILCNDI